MELCSPPRLWWSADVTKYLLRRLVSGERPCVPSGEPEEDAETLLASAMDILPPDAARAEGIHYEWLLHETGALVACWARLAHAPAPLETVKKSEKAMNAALKDLQKHIKKKNRMPRGDVDTPGLGNTLPNVPYIIQAIGDAIQHATHNNDPSKVYQRAAQLFAAIYGFEQLIVSHRAATIS